MKVAGVVVLYNPSDNVLRNIETYINQIDILYVLDNSDKKNNKLVKVLKDIPTIKYLDNHGNKGIANALNIAAIQAIKEGYQYLLTMDQDSKASEEMVKKLVDFILLKKNEKLGIVSAYQKTKEKNYCYNLKLYEQVLVTMTSGNILNLEAYKKTGKFLDKLFIDHVDHEYCLRLNRNGYKIIRLNRAVLYHNLGVTIERKGMKIILHNYVRLYYIVRNFLYIKRKYQKEFPSCIKELEKEVFFSIRRNLIYGNQRLRTVIYIVRAYIDFSRNRFGKID